MSLDKVSDTLRVHLCRSRLISSLQKQLKYDNQGSLFAF